MNKFQKIIALCAIEFVFLLACFVASVATLGDFLWRHGFSYKEMFPLYAFAAAISGVVFLILVIRTYRQKEEKK